MPEKQNWKFKRKGQRICCFPHFLLITELSTLSHLMHTECILFDKHVMKSNKWRWEVNCPLAEHLPRYSTCVSVVSFVWVGLSTVSFSGVFSTVLDTCLLFYPSVEKGMRWHGCPKSSLRSLKVQPSVLSERQSGPEPLSSRTWGGDEVL